MKKLDELILRRLAELGQIAFTVHEDMERWREKPIDGIERTKLSLKLRQAIEEQSAWINALLNDSEEED